MRELHQFEKDELETTKWTAALLIESDHMRVSVNGQYHRIPDSNTPIVPCSHCGAELSRSSNSVGRLARLWAVNMEKPLKLIMSDASNPLGRFRGYPIVALKEECPNCHVKSVCVGQLLY
jgi:hypothetical protein